MRCSIVIPAFNKAELTRACLDALAANTPRNAYEVIVIDNASTDGTDRLLRGRPDPVRTITNRTNVGFTRACNQGARSAQGEFVLFLNNDTEVRPGWLEALLETFASYPAAGVVGARLVYPDGRLQEAGGIIFSDGSGWNYGRGGSPDDPRYRYVREVDYVSGAALMVRHDLLKKIGYLDERYSPGYYEDTDLCFSARAHGYSVLYCPFSTVVHHEGASSGTDLSRGMKRYQVVNREKFVAKWAAELRQQHAPGPAGVVAASERGAVRALLVIDPFLPLFDRASGSLRLFTIVRLLRTLKYHVTYIARNGIGQERYRDLLAKLGVEVYPTDPDALRLLGHAVDGDRIDLKRILTDRRYNAAFLSFYHIALQYLPPIRAFSPHTHIIIDTVDVHFVRERRQAELSGDRDALARAETTRRDELGIYADADAVVTVTEQDWEHVRESLPGMPHFVVPNIHEVPEDPVRPDGRSGLLFIGNFSHPPNADAVRYFLDEIFPRVRMRVPDVTLTIVGNNPPRDLTDLRRPDVTVTGYVPSTEPYLRAARVSVAPLRYGAGMKGKIGEALAHGLPVVTTGIGAEGMGLVDGSTAFIADDPDTFAGHVASLCRDDRLWTEMAQAGRTFIRERYSPERVLDLLTGMLTAVRSLAPRSREDRTAGHRAPAARSYRPGLASIIIPVWNQLAYTKQCVASIMRHTPEPHEIVFVDNGSTDGTAPWLRKLVRKDRRCRLIAHPSNLGFARACNRGIEAATGEYLVLLNNDVIVTEEWLGGMLEHLRRDLRTGIVGPMTNAASGPQQVPSAGYASLDGLPAYAKAFRAANRHRRISLRRIVGFCMLFRSSLAAEIGLLDENFGCGNFEDDDYCLRAELAGYGNLIAGDVFVHHFGSRSFIGNRLDHRASMTGNRRFFTDKWGGLDPGSTEAQLLRISNTVEKAFELFERAETAPAAGLLVELLRQVPGTRTVSLSLARLLLQAKRFGEAMHVLQALPPAAGDEDRLILSAHCDEGIGQDERAAERVDEILARRPDSAPAWNLKGLLAYKRGDRASAQKHFRRAISEDNGYGEPHTSLGMLAWADGRRAEALDLLERGCILSPAEPDCLNAYHSAASELGAVDRLELVLREAKGLHPQDRAIAFLLIDVLIRREKHLEAMTAIEDAMLLFGIDDGMLAAALEVRSKTGPRAPARRPALSVCMIVKNEEPHLPTCLMSVRDLADEIIVVDTGSTDATRNIAQAFGARVFDLPWTGDFSAARNESLRHATGGWVLVLDADEVVAASDLGALRRLIDAGTRTAYALTTRNYVLPLQITGWTANDGRYAREEAGTGWFPSTKVRLFPRDDRIRFSGPVHELVEPSLAAIGMQVRPCPVPVHHYGKLDGTKGREKAGAYYEMLQRKLEEKGEDPATLRELAVQAGELKRYEESIGYWKRLIARKPDAALAYVNMATACEELGRVPEAMEAAQKAVRLAPGLKEAVYGLARCELLAGDAAGCMHTLRGLLEQEPGYEPARVLQAIAACCGGLRDGSAALLNDLLRMDIGFGDALAQLVRKLSDAGRRDYADALADAVNKDGAAEAHLRTQEAASGDR